MRYTASVENLRYLVGYLCSGLGMLHICFD